MSDERLQEFHTDDVSLLKPGKFFRWVEQNFRPIPQKYYPDLGSDASSAVWKICARSSDGHFAGKPVDVATQATKMDRADNLVLSQK